MSATVFTLVIPDTRAECATCASTLSSPSMVLGETAPSFLGLGLRPPIIGRGVLLATAANINPAGRDPWLMLPVVPLIIVVLAIDLLGRDPRGAADPYEASVC
jgi:peptide/nickel transport system permease protein